MSIEQLDSPARIPQLLEDREITNLMHMIWESRKDLQLAFNLDTQGGQQGFCHWYDVSVLREYGIAPQSAHLSEKVGQETITPQYIPLHFRLMQLESAVGRIGRSFPMPFKNLAKSVWFRMLSLAARTAQKNRKRQSTTFHLSQPETVSVPGVRGANLIGYAHAEVGMGEHVRMTATALATTDIRFGVLNFNVGIPSRQQAALEHGELVKNNLYRTNLFHINADQMLKAYCHLGRQFFTDRYNVGYWAWELAKCPDEWVPVIDMVDEIWAPSRFIQQAFSEKTNKSVEYMPLCVSLPSLPEYRRSYFGLPDDAFLFLFTFDFFSYIDRKNPFATIQSFKIAFPDRSTQVGLVIKVMNGDANRPEWKRMLEMIENDTRIIILNQTMSREDVLGLFGVCDSFVSLHRSEGFGRGPAEAMYMGKPVIVTNYSGNTDFTLSDNSLPC